MKKVLALLLIFALLLTFGACNAESSSGSQASSSNKALKDLKVCVLIHGLLGDNGYFDSAARGAKKLKDELGVQVQIVEMGKDSSAYEPALTDASESGYDLIIMGGFRWFEIIEKVAEKYPDQKYVMYDNIGNFSQYKNDNVYAYSFAAEQGSFLAGAAAALSMKDATGAFKNVKANNTIGVLCSADEPMLNNFVCGYMQGAEYIDPSIKILSAYIGSGQDTVKAKELALQMYSQGANFVFTPAGQTIMSIIEAAKEKKGYVIGCDSDQSTLIKDKDPAGSALTITSMLKCVDNTIYDTVVAFSKGEIKFGTGTPMGLKDNAVTLAYNDNYKTNVPKAIQDQVEKLRQDIISGKIRVWRASDRAPADVIAYRNKFLPK